MRAAGLLLLVLSGCATSQPFVFRPTETANLTPDNSAVARYVVPRVLPRGELFATSEGVVPASANGKEGPALMVRITVFNVAGKGPWAIDIRDQLVTLPGGIQIHASDVKTTAQGAPILAITPGERITMDLYFALPENQQTPGEIAGFNFIWQVSTDRQRAAGMVPFARFDSTAPAGSTATVTTVASATPF
ncbi:MAG TPA: hypothetical protein VGL59_10585 [Polyangia bacterium]|jgi:hypothetical protein